MKTTWQRTKEGKRAALRTDELTLLSNRPRSFTRAATDRLPVKSIDGRVQYQPVARVASNDDGSEDEDSSDVMDHSEDDEITDSRHAETRVLKRKPADVPDEQQMPAKRARLTTEEMEAGRKRRVRP